MTAPEPTPLERAAEALLHYDTNGLCDLGKACDLCDCGMNPLSPQDRDQRTRREIDRARHAAEALLGGDWLERVLGEHSGWHGDDDGIYCDDCGDQIALWDAYGPRAHRAHQAAAIRAAAGVKL